jgi:hypothetical protein
VRPLTLDALARGVGIACDDAATWSLLSAVYGAMRGERETLDLEYRILRDGRSAGLRIERCGQEPILARDDGALLTLFDAEVVVALQRLRPDLYFVHAAVLERDGAAVMLVARSGGGKSTLSWALLHHGFRYLSDELAPVDLSTLGVLPYPRALLVKRDPPTSHPISGGLRTSRGVHVPAEAMPGEIATSPASLAAVFFLEYRPEASGPSATRLSPAAAAVQLYANALNPLAHDGEGLDAAIAITAGRPCFDLVVTELTPTCELLATTLARSG